MEENNYYNPELEEFHKGFIFMWKDEFGEWKEQSYDGLYFESLSDDIKNGKIKVKLLDKEDIKAEGFTPSRQRISLEKCPEFKRDNLYIWQASSKFYGENKWMIERKQGTDFLTMFFGTINNKSELRKILKMIGV